MEPESRMSFGDHLDELRVRLIRCLIVIVLGAIVCYTFRNDIMDLIIGPVEKVLAESGAKNVKLVYFNPVGAFMPFVKIAIYAGFLLASPFCLYQAWAFVQSGLLTRERKYVYRFAPFSIGMFLGGAVLCYLFMVPITLNFLLNFPGELLDPVLRVDDVINFVLLLMLMMGVVFETPLVMLFLSYIGVGTVPFYNHYRRHFILIAAILSAFLTPADLPSMVMMAVPLILLYEVGILLVRVAGKRVSAA